MNGRSLLPVSLGIDNVFVIEQRLQEIIQELLISKEYVEFLAGRNGEFDQLVASTVRRCKRTVRDDNSAIVLVLSYYNGRISQ